MKDISEFEYRKSRPEVGAKKAIGFCLEQLFKDRKVCNSDELAKNLTYEELIGALLLAEDLVNKSIGKITK